MESAEEDAVFKVDDDEDEQNESKEETEDEQSIAAELMSEGVSSKRKRPPGPVRAVDNAELLNWTARGRLIARKCGSELLCNRTRTVRSVGTWPATPKDGLKTKTKCAQGSDSECRAF